MATAIGRASDIPVGTAVAFQVQGQSIGVANVEGRLFAFDDVCTHRGCSVSEGMLQGTSITCPCHFSVFQVTDGAVLGGPAKVALTTYPVELKGEEIIVSLDQERSVGESRALSDAGPGSISAPVSGHPDEPGPSESSDKADHDRLQGALASVPLFADLDPASIESLEAFTFRKKFLAGEVVVEEGRTGNGLYVVLSGSVEVIKGLGGTRPQRVAVLHEGEPFGEMALLGDWKRSASVRAIEDVECLGMDRWAFLTHLKNEPNLAIRMVQMLAARLTETNERLAE
jgi:nitrite reductase/ring-hydroxylating ferredoxin subunit